LDTRTLKGQNSSLVGFFVWVYYLFTMKKHIFIVGIILFPMFASAFITLSPPNTQMAEKPISITCSQGDTAVFYDSTGQNGGGTACNGISGTSTLGIITIVECDSSVLLSNCGLDSTLALAELDTGFVSKITYLITPFKASALTLFDPNTSGNEDFISGITASVGTTGNGLFPIIALIIGIILAIIFATQIIDLVHETKNKQKTKRKS
jgi:hypothetical protein